ncbi:clavesin-2-like isoform X2 [Venturia canescens]|uniref:clavesin-2-like isoform X2 n=1 Tax=Venturia canescens TaxID=32260 RepID=UPI001C9CDF37|nr:clavesin-2-like isoform X2 [Venturia canescens]
MSGIEAKGNLNTDDNVVDKKTIKDSLKDVTSDFESLLIDSNKIKKWDENVVENPIPRVKDRGDRLSSIFLETNDSDEDGILENIEKNYDETVKEDSQVNYDEDEELDLDLDEPSSLEVIEYARHELGETDEIKCQTLQELRDMIYERGECTPHRVDDAFLIRFLRARNFNVNRAHRLVVRYYDFKEEHPDIHQGVDPLKMRHIGDDDVMTVPGYRTRCGRRMMIYRIGNWDPKKYGIEELFKATVIILELGILEPVAQILGGVVIFDLEGITMAHAWTITPQISLVIEYEIQNIERWDANSKPSPRTVELAVRLPAPRSNVDIVNNEFSNVDNLK